MSTIEVARSDYRRSVAHEASIALRNRFFEQNPVLNAGRDFTSLIARPALKKFIEVGDGPIRKLFNEPGVFGGDLFVVSATDLYRVSAATGLASFIGDIGPVPGDPSMAATAPIGVEPAHLFIAAGSSLWLYLETGQATGTLTASAIANSDVVRIDGTYYQFTTGSVDAGTPAGTLANPWLVARSGTLATDLISLHAAINGSGTAGTTYSTVLTRHTTVTATAVTGTTVVVTAVVHGPDGNSIVTTETGANMAWGGGTLAGGGADPLTEVAMPDSAGAISVAHINSYVIVLPVQSEALVTVGRFYWIEPGEITVDPFDFATAERAPDELHQVIVFGDMFWLLGQKTTEPWVTTGDSAAPMLRFTGILFDRGSWQGTAVQIKDLLMVIDEDGGVHQIAGGVKNLTENRPDIAERIRRALQVQEAV